TPEECVDTRERARERCVRVCVCVCVYLCVCGCVCVSVLVCVYMCGVQLTEPILLCLGIKTGCPWRAVNYILSINQWADWMSQCAPPEPISPNPVQAYADHVQMSSHQENIITDVLNR